MPVTVDHESLPAEQLGLHTVGHVLTHLQKANRLVVQLLIDGEEPDLSRLTAARQVTVNDHTLYVETADPRQLAMEVLGDVQTNLQNAEELKAEAIELLQQNNPAKAMERLSSCFATWQHAQESVLKTAQLLRIDLSHIRVEDRPLTEMLGQFTEQLRQIKVALENRDFVLLTDILTYELTQTTGQWQAAMESMRIAVSDVR